MYKEKITSKEELEEALNFIAVDDCFDNPFKDPNITEEEYLKHYDENMRKIKMAILKADYDICIEDDKE
ncbi:hypothetical protein IJT93_03420 [bacterium]|nr:hypothetical protein [bacterium]